MAEIQNVGAYHFCHSSSSRLIKHISVEFTLFWTFRLEHLLPIVNRTQFLRKYVTKKKRKKSDNQYTKKNIIFFYIFIEYIICRFRFTIYKVCHVFLMICGRGKLKGFRFLDNWTYR